MNFRLKTASSSILILFSIASIFLLLFIVLPLLSTATAVRMPGFWTLFSDRQVIESIQLTFWSAFIAVLIGIIGGIPFAYLLARYRFPGRELLHALINLPVVIPHTAAGVALILVFGRFGYMGKFFSLIGIQFTDRVAGIVIAMLFVSVPFLVNAARDAFAGVDIDLEQAALVDGANLWQVFFTVTLPLSLRGIFSGLIMMWARGVSEFGAVVIIAYHPKIMPVLVYERFQGFGLSAALPVTVFLILVSFVVFIMLNLLRKQPEI